MTFIPGKAVTTETLIRETESLRAENERLKEAVKDKDATIARLREALEYKVKWVVEMRDGLPWAWRLESPSPVRTANRRAIQAEEMRKCEDLQDELGFIHVDEIRKFADRHEKGEKR